jgi:hypothetical protein
MADWRSVVRDRREFDAVRGDLLAIALRYALPHDVKLDLCDTRVDHSQRISRGI